jgi:hypothetical protein
VGRVAFNHHGPVVLPVNFAMDGDHILICTSPHGYLGRQIRSCVAAFQCDDLDEDTGAGWTVLVQGPAECLNGQDVHRLTHRPDRWGAGLQWLHVRISPRSVTGRRYPGADSHERRTRPAHFPSQLRLPDEVR